MGTEGTRPQENVIILHIMQLKQSLKIYVAKTDKTERKKDIQS